MPKTHEQIEDRLIQLGEKISTGSPEDYAHQAQQNMPEWKGGDVRVTSDFNRKPNNWADEHDLQVRTRHAKSLTWLFYELKDTFPDFLNVDNKYGFYGSLAQAALTHLASNQPELDDPKPLLNAVLAEGFDHLKCLKENGALPSQSPSILHQTDEEGRQKRIDLGDGSETA